MTDVTRRKKYWDELRAAVFNGNGLARQLMVCIVLFSSFFTFFFTALQLYEDYTEDVSLIEYNFTLIRNAHLTSLREALWTQDVQQIEILLRGVTQFPDMAYAGISVEGAARWASGAPLQDRYQEESYRLTYEYRGIKVDIGVLTVQANLNNIYSRLGERLLSILLSNAIKTFFVGIFILIVFQLIVTRHLYRITDFAENIDMADADRNQLILARAQSVNRNDALDRLASSINGMCRRIAQANRDIATAQDKLEKASRSAIKANKAKSEFLTNMSHELRTPLNAIIGFSDIIKNQYFGPPGQGKYQEYGGDIHASAIHLLELVSGILDLSAVESGGRDLEMAALEMDDVITECLRVIGPIAVAKKINVIYDGKAGSATIWADHTSVIQILLNVITNAVKYTKAGGEINLSVRSTNTGSKVVISDTGVGMHSERLQQVTETFTRVNPDPFIAEEGWGLGLAITKSLVEQHGGALKIQSEQGIGTTVTIFLPNEEALPGVVHR